MPVIYIITCCCLEKCWTYLGMCELNHHGHVTHSRNEHMFEKFVCWHMSNTQLFNRSVDASQLYDIYLDAQLSLDKQSTYGDIQKLGSTMTRKGTVWIPVIKRRKKTVQGVDNQLHSGIVCSCSIGHVSVLNLELTKQLEKGNPRKKH